MTEEACRVFISFVMHELGRDDVPTVRFDVADDDDASAILPEEATQPAALLLPIWARQRNVILHELAHVLTDEVDHGSAFIWAYFGLLTRFNNVPAAKLFAEMKTWKLA